MLLPLLSVLLQTTSDRFVSQYSKIPEKDAEASIESTFSVVFCVLVTF